ncbi:NAD(+) synthase [Lentisphaera profundi]|uniref:Glutamine-dependent NAD(+) synthetase n=1 Tax=Lentisphaera profundi TaxID=1658616 RepID=A0ABY7VVP7_9BACT|nr:NAD(+) synthase [Lentisphaera profundi]WDE97358.1 NAD(+) synthase [Lentisphaera profundi]
MQISAISINQTALDWDNNLDRIKSAISQCSTSDFILFPEMSLTAYGCEDVFLSQHLRVRTLALLKDLVPCSKNKIIAVGLPLEIKKKLYNAIAVLADEKIIGFYCKKHLANDGLHYEKRWFEPWPDRLVETINIDGQLIPVGDCIFQVNNFRFGFEICQDAWEESRFDSHLSELQLDLVLNPSASHFALGKQKIRKQLIIDGAKNFDCHYLYANLNGNESGRIIYDGAVFFSSPDELLYESQRLHLEEFRVHQFESEIVAKEKYTQSPCLVHFTHEFNKNKTRGAIANYPATEPLDQYQEFLLAETLGLFDYMRKSWSKGFILSLSGGVDSATCATLVYHMCERLIKDLGLSEVHSRLSYIPEIQEVTCAKSLSKLLLSCVYQASANSGPVTEKAAQELAKAIGAQYHFFDIEPLLQMYRQLNETAMGRELAWESDDLAMQNIQARGRAPGVWMMANLKGALLLTTSNRSEAAVGYATMDGDTCGGLSPLAGIGKVFLRQFLKEIEHHQLCGLSSIPALAYVNAQEPTAELRPPGEEQKDEEDLMPYEVLDQIQKLAIRDRMSPKEIFNELCKDTPEMQSFGYLKRFFTLWSRNQWKRERYAPAFHLDDESLDPKTWCRFPILSGSFKLELSEIEQELKEV